MNNKTISFKSGIVFIISLLCFQITIAQNKLKTGDYTCYLQLNDSIKLPFIFYLELNQQKYSAKFINGKEHIITDEIVFKKDSVIIKMPVFDSEFRCKIINDHELEGLWINYARKDKNKIPFHAFNYIKEAYCSNMKQLTAFGDGVNIVYETTFSTNTKDASKAVGIFKSEGYDRISGTFLTETGDYRYLTGKLNCDNIHFSLSTFDGSHAFVFTGKVKGDSIINGQFYSGSHWHEPWVAVRNDKFQLRNPDSLTYLKPGFSKIDFSFKNLEGKTVSLSDEKFKNKVVIIQIMGSWCPNCMDETAFLAPLYEKNKSKGLEIVALAFERTEIFTKAASNVSRLKKRYNANYEFLITGKTGKDMASEALPMLNGIMAFPTTIFIDKKGVVRKIHTGFTGPGTGEYYTRFVEQTNMFLEKLLQE